MQYQFGPGPLKTDYDTDIAKAKGTVGIVEDTNVATHAIPAGYYVIWKGDLYVAKTDISSGTTLSAASGGNLTAKTQRIGKDLVALNNKVTFDAIITNLNNTSLEGGHYYYGANSTGAPSTTAGRLIQIKSSSSVWGGQIAVPNSSSFLMYARMLTSSGYGEWQELAINSKITNVETVVNPTGYDSTVLDEVRAYRRGNVVTVFATVKANLSSEWHNDVLSGLPTRFRPSQQVHGSHRVNAGADVGKNICVTLHPSGVLQWITYEVFTASIPVSFTFVAIND